MALPTDFSTDAHRPLQALQDYSQTSLHEYLRQGARGGRKDFDPIGDGWFALGRCASGQRTGRSAKIDGFEIDELTFENYSGGDDGRAFLQPMTGALQPAPPLYLGLPSPTASPSAPVSGVGLVSSATLARLQAQESQPAALKPRTPRGKAKGGAQPTQGFEAAAKAFSPRQLLEADLMQVRSRLCLIRSDTLPVRLTHGGFRCSSRSRTPSARSGSRPARGTRAPRNCLWGPASQGLIEMTHV